MIDQGHGNEADRLIDKVCHERGKELYVGEFLEAVLCKG
jgi:hypothetical protein